MEGRSTSQDEIDEGQPVRTVEPRQEQNTRRRKMEAADSYLGVASKVLTIMAALSTVSIWAYTTFYVGSIEVKTDKPVDVLTVKLYDERGLESVYHTDHMKVTPGNYGVVVESPDHQSSRYKIAVNFNAPTVVSYAVQPTTAESENQDAGAANSDEQKNRRWWQFWKRN